MLAAVRAAAPRSRTSSAPAGNFVSCLGWAAGAALALGAGVGCAAGGVAGVAAGGLAGAAVAAPWAVRLCRTRNQGCSQRRSSTRRGPQTRDPGGTSDTARRQAIRSDQRLASGFVRDDSDDTAEIALFRRSALMKENLSKATRLGRNLRQSEAQLPRRSSQHSLKRSLLADLLRHSGPGQPCPTRRDSTRTSGVISSSILTSSFPAASSSSKDMGASRSSRNIASVVSSVMPGPDALPPVPPAAGDPHVVPPDHLADLRMVDRRLALLDDLERLVPTRTDQPGRALVVAEVLPADGQAVPDADRVVGVHHQVDLRQRHTPDQRVHRGPGPLRLRAERPVGVSPRLDLRVVDRHGLLRRLRQPTRATCRRSPRCAGRTPPSPAPRSRA